MSRTYRRKKGVSAPEWVTHDSVPVEEFSKKGRYWCDGEWHNFRRVCFLYKEVPRVGCDLKENLAKYHSDNASVMGSAPSWFVNKYFTRKYRSLERQELKRLLLNGGDYEEYSFKPYKHGAMWEWW